MDTKNKLVSQLDIKFKGLDKSVLERIAEKLSKTVRTEEEIATAVEGVTFQNVIDSYTESRVTEAQQTAIRNYEQKHNLRDGVKIETSETTQKTEPEKEQPEWAKTLIDSISALSNKVREMETDKVRATRGQRLEELIKDLPDSLRSPYKRLALDTYKDEDFEHLMTELAGEVEGLKQEVSSRGAVFGKPFQSNGLPGKTEQATEDELKGVIDSIV